MVRILFQTVLGAAELEALRATRFGDVRWVAEVGSTNAELLALARAGAPEGTVLVADHQSAGRGRLGRSWHAPPGASLLASVLLRPALPPGRAHLVTVAAALAAADACVDVGGFGPDLKWPNDLVVDVDGTTRKLAGVLTEALVAGGALDALVVGMGLNVAWPGPPPDDVAAVAVTAAALAGRALDRAALLTAWLVGLERRYATLGAGSGAVRLVEEYRSRCATLGRRVRVELAATVVVGVAVDVTDDGHLVVEGDDGFRHDLAVGDVVHLRPAAP